MKRKVIGLLVISIFSSCSVQQFAVNTRITPFQNGGKVWGERVEKCGENGWKSEFKKDKDIHLLGINIRKSNVSVMVEELDAKHYTIETKSNLIVQLLSFGIVDYKIVKVLKRIN
jgi:hypothetical protein